MMTFNSGEISFQHQQCCHI